VDNSLDSFAYLVSLQVLAIPEIKRVLDIGAKAEVIQEVNGTYQPTPIASAVQRSNESPFVVIEGLDGSGESLLLN